MPSKFIRGHTFTDGPPSDDVVAAYLHALIEEAAPTTAFVDDQVEKSLVTGDYAFIKDTPGNRLAKVKTDALLGQVQSGITVGDIQVPDNAIQNAEMWYWQRGLNVDRVINGTNLKIFGPDRFQLLTNGTWNIKIRNLDDQDLALSGYPRQNRVARITAVGAHATLLASDVVDLRYQMEGRDFARIDGLPWTFTLWVRTNRTGTMYMGIRAYVTHYDSTYENFCQDALINPNGVTAIQLSFPARTSNLAKKNNESTLGLDLTLAAGTDSQGAASTVWQTGGTPQTTTRQTNFLDAANNYVDIWGPCLRTGSIAVPHRVNPYGAAEIRRLQRYYCKSYPSSINPATSSQGLAVRNHCKPSTTLQFGHRFPTEMRANPTVTIYSIGGTANSVDTPSGVLTVSSMSKGEAGIDYIILSTATTADGSCNFHYTAEADF